jgi:hypothetical protein
MGFSIVGLIIAVSIFAPNLLMVVLPPRNVPDVPKNSRVIFTALERVGQIGCLALLVISKNNSIDLWLIPAAICVICYYGLWIRYAVTGRDFGALFKPLIIPIPMAVLPILAFGFTALWSGSLWLAATDALFAAGHITNSLNTYKYIKARDWLCQN